MCFDQHSCQRVHDKLDTYRTSAEGPDKSALSAWIEFTNVGCLAIMQLLQLSILAAAKQSCCSLHVQLQSQQQNATGSADM